MNSRRPTFPLIAALLLAACAGDPAPALPDGGAGSIPPGDSPEKRAAAAALFAEDRFPTIQLILPAANLAAIDANPTAEQWVEGTLNMDGEVVEGVGIRYKGSEGAWYGCVEGGPWNGGRKLCPLNMKVKIDYRADASFHGIKTLQLHAMNDHPAKLTETVAYWFVRQMGVPAPRTAYCQLLLNGRFEGLYLLVEEMDGRFVDAWQPDSDANLFKEVWPLSWDGTATPSTAMIDGLRSNEKKADVANFQAFAQALAAAPDLAAIRAVIEQWMDVDQALALAALTLALDDDDGVFHWYALDASSPSAARPHNFYWLEDPAHGKFRLLPWDLDKSFTLVAHPDLDNAIELLDPWGTTSHDCQNYGPGWRQRSAACDRLVAGLASYPERYRAKLQATLDGPFAEVDAFLDAWTLRLAPRIAALPAANAQGITVDGWQAGVADLRQEIADARARVASAVAAR